MVEVLNSLKLYAYIGLAIFLLTVLRYCYRRLTGKFGPNELKNRIARSEISHWSPAMAWAANLALCIIAWPLFIYLECRLTASKM